MIKITGIAGFAVCVWEFFYNFVNVFQNDLGSLSFVVARFKIELKVP
jgi:hypothetical protein